MSQRPLYLPPNICDICDILILLRNSQNHLLHDLCTYIDGSVTNPKRTKEISIGVPLVEKFAAPLHYRAFFTHECT
jgi:hypothetical protein